MRLCVLPGCSTQFTLENPNPWVQQRPPPTSLRNRSRGGPVLYPVAHGPASTVKKWAANMESSFKKGIIYEITIVIQCNTM